jgi:hypothetical protein
VSPLAPVIEPVEISSAPEGDVEMVDLFSVDGVMYQIPARPPFNVALKAMKLARTEGAGFAEMAILEEVIGPDAWDALCNAKGVTGKQIAQLSNAVARLVLGGMEDADPNS